MPGNTEVCSKNFAKALQPKLDTRYVHKREQHKAPHSFVGHANQFVGSAIT